jgi:hypothetical protein
MGKTTVTKFRWFWAWQDEAEENWLEKMSKKGYHLSSVGLPCFYTFSIAKPRNYAYRLDYQMFRKKDKGEYLQLFSDAGWEHIGEMSAWQYFRKETKPSEPTEIFTDVESKIAKYKRVLAFLGFFYVILMTLIFTQRLPHTLSDDPYPWWGNIPQAIIVLVLIFFIYAIIKLTIRIRQLRKTVR